ncbi:MAG: class I SAM-dependent methyltransferase [Desulfovibrionaceae bacterium]
MDRDTPHAQVGRQCRRKRFSEGLLDNDRILRELALAPGMTVLDAGCGTGYMAKLFSVEVGPAGVVHAVDVDADYVDRLREETAGSNIRPLAADMAKGTSLDAGSVDTAYLSTVLHAQSREKLAGFIRELRRLLRPGGTLAVVEMAKVETPFGPPLGQRYSPEELCAALPFEPLRTVPVAEFFYLQLFRA